jgi:hypothetical protein
MQEKLEKKTEESINKILEEGITTNNLDHLYKLTKINCMAKKGEDSMNYGYGNYRGNYGRDEYGRDNYGEYGRDSYGRRGYDRRYRGDDYMDRMSNEYGRYMESRERYGAGEESDKAFHFMAKALGEYLDFLHEEADTPQKKQMLNETLQRSMR